MISVKIPGGGAVSKQMGGCVAESEEKLNGDPREWFRAEKTSGHLRSLHVPKVLADQRFSAALAERKLTVADATCARAADLRPIGEYVMRRSASVMNRGFIGGRDVVAFYAEKDYPSAKGYLCLVPGERWADLLTDNYFANTGEVVNDRIRSHRWVTASECGLGNWLT